MSRAVPARAALVLLATLGLAGCGVKGPLEPPPGAQAPPAPASGAVAAPAPASGAMSTPRSSNEMADTITPRADWQTGARRSNPSSEALIGAQRPDQPFILDGLL